MIRRGLFCTLSKVLERYCDKFAKLPMHTLEQILVGSNTQPPTPHLAPHKLSVFLEHKGGSLISLLSSRNESTQAKTYGLLSGGDQQWKDWKKLLSIGNFLNEGSIW